MKAVSIVCGDFYEYFNRYEAAATTATTSNDDDNYIFIQFLNDVCDDDCDCNMVMMMMHSLMFVPCVIRRSRNNQHCTYFYHPFILYTGSYMFRQ
jgi:hypothetical protein